MTDDTTQTIGDAPEASAVITPDGGTRLRGRLHIAVRGGSARPLSPTARAIIAGAATGKTGTISRTPARRHADARTRMPVVASNPWRRYVVEQVPGGGPLSASACAPGDVVEVGGESYTVVRRTPERVHLLASSKSAAWNPAEGRVPTVRN